MKRALLVIVLVCLVLSGCNREMYSQERGFKYKTYPANDPVGYWYKYGSGRTFKVKKHKFMF